MSKRVVRVKWAKTLDRECGHSWPAREGEVVWYQDECSDEVKDYPARGPHRCVKDRDHIDDITDDEHQCCCGNSDWVTP